MMMEQKLDAYVDVSGGDEVEVADVELSQGVLTVTMPQKKGVFVVNKQSPNRCVLDTSCTILCVCVCVDRRRHTYMPPTISLVYGSRKLIHTNHYICVYTCGQADFRHIYICVCVFPNHFCTILPVHGYEKKQNPNSTTTTLDNVGSYGYRRRSPDPVDSSSRPCQARGSACGATENSAPRSRAKWKCFLTEQSRNGNGRQQR